MTFVYHLALLSAMGFDAVVPNSSSPILSDIFFLFLQCYARLPA
jgi:hypothetical protein